MVENNLCSYHLFHAFLAVILSNGNTYFTWVCTWTKFLCLSTFPEAGFESVLRYVCGPWIIVLQTDLRENRGLFFFLPFFFQKQLQFFKLQLVKTWLIPRDHLSEPTHMQGPVFFPARTQNWRHMVEVGFWQCFWHSLVQGELSAHVTVIFNSFQTWRPLCYLPFTSCTAGKPDRAAVLQRLIKKLSGGVRNPIQVTL